MSDSMLKDDKTQPESAHTTCDTQQLKVTKKAKIRRGSKSSSNLLRATAETKRRQISRRSRSRRSKSVYSPRKAGNTKAKSKYDRLRKYRRAHAPSRTPNQSSSEFDSSTVSSILTERTKKSRRTYSYSSRTLPSKLTPTKSERKHQRTGSSTSDAKSPLYDDASSIASTDVVHTGLASMNIQGESERKRASRNRKSSPRFGPGSIYSREKEHGSTMVPHRVWCPNYGGLKAYYSPENSPKSNLSPRKPSRSPSRRKLKSGSSRTLITSPRVPKKSKRRNSQGSRNSRGSKLSLLSQKDKKESTTSPEELTPTKAGSRTSQLCYNAENETSAALNEASLGKLAKGSKISQLSHSVTKETITTFNGEVLPRAKMEKKECLEEEKPMNDIGAVVKTENASSKNENCQYTSFNLDFDIVPNLKIEEDRKEFKDPIKVSGVEKVQENSMSNGKELCTETENVCVKLHKTDKLNYQEVAAEMSEDIFYKIEKTSGRLPSSPVEPADEPIRKNDNSSYHENEISELRGGAVETSCKLCVFM
mmetsp:Transcript_20587/g.30809  ORF Transcript_20587/g.30809 Transcript_20587/m.30809 type:complete len:535 (+) Transcript_20587:65-1669(+)